MKRILYPIAIIALSYFSSVAQITVTNTDLPTPGTPYLLGVNNTNLTDLTPGGSGSQTWDFSSYALDTYDTTGTLLPQSTPYADQFPQATHATKTKDAEGITYTYYKASSTLVEVIGIAFEPLNPILPKGILKPSSTLKFLTLPLANGYATESIGVYSGKSSYSNSAYPVVDSVEITMVLVKKDTIDAYGSIKVPNGNVFNSLRLKTVATRKLHGKIRVNTGPLKYWQTLKEEDGFPKVAKETSYNWWANNVGTEVFKIKYEDSTSATPTSARWYNPNRLGLAESSLDAKWVLSPNPANNLLYFEGIEEAFKVTISTVQGMSVTTKIVESDTLDISSLAPGIYVATLQVSSGARLQRKFIVSR